MLNQNLYFIVKKKNQPISKTNHTSLTKLLFSNKKGQKKKDQHEIDPNPDIKNN